MILASCSSEAYDSPQIEETLIDVDDVTGVQHDILVNILSSKFGGYRKGQPATRALSSFSLTPYVEDGDTLLYIVQYNDGWEIYSANQATNMILFSSEKGRFDIKDPNMPDAMRLMLNTELSIIKATKDKYESVDNTWGAPSISESELNEGNITVKKRNQSRQQITSGDLPPGHWELIKTEVLVDKRVTSPKLIKTKWGQLSPWNLYAKRVNYNGSLLSTPAGCVAVALSQYMYYTHFKDGVPATSVSSASLTSDRLDFTFSGASTTIWDKMALTSNDKGTTEVALLLGKVGRDVSSIYQLGATGSGPSYSIPYLMKVYDTSFYREPFDFDKIVDIIDKGYPVIADAITKVIAPDGSENNVGHYFLIDQYATYEYSAKYTYGLVRDPWDSEDGDDPWESNDVDENGNVITWVYTNEVLRTTDYKKVTMNWGWDGDYDSTFYYLDDTWNPNNIAFDYERYINIRADIK